jgi:hypothetical protein
MRKKYYYRNNKAKDFRLIYDKVDRGALLAYKEVLKMRSPSITGQAIANSLYPYGEFSKFIDETNTFIVSASDCRDSLMKICKKIDKPYNVSANYEFILDSKNKEDLGLIYSYDAKEISITDEVKTREIIERRAKYYTAHNFLKNTAINNKVNYNSRIYALWKTNLEHNKPILSIINHCSIRFHQKLPHVILN